MNIKDHNPNASVPDQTADAPRGDRGRGERTWSPEQGEQGISNRVEDEDDNEFEDEQDDSDDEDGGEEDFDDSE